MAVKLGGLCAALVAALVLGVGGAAGRSLVDPPTTLVVQVIGGGSVTGTAGTITCGAGNKTCYYTTTAETGTVVLTATNQGIWSFSNWDCGAAGESVSSNTCTITFDATSREHEVTAEFTPSPAQGTNTLTLEISGDVNDDESEVVGGDIDCTVGDDECTWEDVYTGSTLTLVETAGTDAAFSGWGGACSGTATSCTVQLNSDLTVSATFAGAPTNQTLSVAVTGNGTVAGGGVSCTSAGGSGCTASVPNGQTVTLTATPSSGAGFTGWGGACAGSSTTCTVTMDAAKSVTATFTGTGGGGTSTFPLSVSVTGNGRVTGSGIDCGGGNTSCSQNITSGTTVTLTAAPSSGASFSGWGGACSGTATTCTVTMSAARSVSATFTGGTTGSTFALTVSVSGDGTVTGSGIECGSGSTDCSASVTAGTTVTLTAEPDSGASFSGWGGACSGTATTCTVTMTAARSVTATFSGASGTKVLLQVSVQGPGKVTGGGIACGSGSTTCSAQQSQGATITLAAAPAAGATFVRWSGACSGATLTCTVAMAAAKSVTATFRSGSGGGAAGRGLLSRGRPIVTKTRSGFAVTLRFQTSVRGTARVRALRAGQLETAFSFAAPVGRANVGPFPLAKAGFYLFELRLGGRGLNWTACLGRCAQAAAAAGPFTLSRQPSTVARAGALWSVLLHFRSTQPAGADLRVYRSKRLIRELRFPTHAGLVSPNPLLLSPGSYSVRLVALDAYGRVRTLTWIALLP
ncbi:MAG TPA: hypothetical protein VJT84_11155 [Gaiellaceae bacterium]|nr:hypothetical protein [Gaiellaceae bacterium]